MFINSNFIIPAYVYEKVFEIMSAWKIDMRFNNLFLLIIICCISIVGCTNTNNTSLVISTPTQTSIPITETPIPPTQTLAPTSIPTIVPTLSVDDARKKLLDLLANNGDCHLPCLWGIMPGKSTYQEVRTILTPLSSLSNLTHLNYSDNGGISPQYMEDHLTISTKVDYVSSSNNIISHITFEGRAWKAWDYGSAGPGIKNIFDSKTFGQRLNFYMLPQVLSEQGMPVAVVLQAIRGTPSGGFEIVLLYPDQGMLVHYTTQMEIIGANLRGCPANAHVELELFPPGHADSFAEFLSKTNWAFLWPSIPDDSNWRPIEKATSMSLEQFYEIFRQPTNKCIESPAKLWSTQ